MVDFSIKPQACDAVGRESRIIAVRELTSLKSFTSRISNEPESIESAASAHRVTRLVVVESNLG